MLRLCAAASLSRPVRIDAGEELAVLILATLQALHARQGCRRLLERPNDQESQGDFDL
jgi:hypothetical protein